MRGSRRSGRASVATARLSAGLVMFLVACLGGLLTACSETGGLQPTSSGASGGGTSTASPGAASGGPSGGASSGGATAAPSSFAVADPGHLRGRLHPADILVTSSRTIAPAVRREVLATSGVSAALALSWSSVPADGRTLSVAAADPGGFRRYMPFASARSDAVWRRVASGEVAVDPSLPRRLQQPEGYLQLGTSRQAPALHIGAFAPLAGQVSAFVNLKRARQLGMPRANAMLLSVGTGSPAVVASRLRSALGDRATVSTLALEFDTDAQRTAVLSGGSVSRAVGTFTYVPHPDGTVTPDPRWVRTYIRREPMPLLGEVTGNKGMLPQLRAALEEVQRRGLGGSIHKAEYGGCYVPRYIARDPAQGLSLHSWGMAVDLNVPGNLRGTVGRIDRRVVAIMERWGFAWGGDWSYTDPMHFEMNRVVPVPTP